MKKKIDIEVSRGDNLAALLKAFPGASVRRLVCGAGEDGWRVSFDPQDPKPGGPSRVVVAVTDGTVAYAVPPDRAAEEYGITPDIVFFRDDGWSLGARLEDRDPAFKLWEGDWVAVMDLRTGIINPVMGLKAGKDAEDCPQCGRVLVDGGCPDCDGSIICPECDDDPEYVDRCQGCKGTGRVSKPVPSTIPMMTRGDVKTGVVGPKPSHGADNARALEQDGLDDDPLPQLGVITYQRAAAICKAEGLDYQAVKDGDPQLLKTGAKLVRTDGEFQVYGYAHDGKDVEPYV